MDQFSDSILYLGPYTRGGMTAVIDSYRLMFGPIRYIPTYHGGGKARKALDLATAYARTAWTLATDRRIRLVHIHTASNASFRRKSLLARLARAMGRKVVMHVHGGGFETFYRTDPKGISTELRRADAVVALSENWRQFFAGIGVDATVIQNPVPEAHRTAIDDDGRLHILFLGLLEEAKGVADIIEAARRSASRWAGRVVIHIGGEGPLRQMVEEAQADPAMGGTIVYEGYVSGQHKIDLLNRCRVYLLPSYAEGLPVSIIEAMSYGMAVIASAVGGIPTQVTDGINGILITPGDVDGMTAAIDRLLSDPAALRTMGEASVAMSAPYSIEAVKDRLVTLYTTLLSPDKD